MRRRIDLDFDEAFWAVTEVCLMVAIIMLTVVFAIAIGLFTYDIVTEYTASETEPAIAEEAGIDGTDIYETEVIEDGVYE